MKSKQTLKVGQKYRVIKDCSDSKYNGKIVTVEKILDEDYFTCRGRDYILGDEDNDEILELITPKKKSKEIEPISEGDMRCLDSERLIDKLWEKQCEVIDTINLLIKRDK